MMNDIRSLLVCLACITVAASCQKDDEPEVIDTPPSDPNDTLDFPPHTPVPYVLQIPANLPAMFIPPNNPMTEEGVALGRYLFFEERLSGNNTMSCATCHASAYAFTDPNGAVSTGIDGITGTRSAMALVNLGWGQSFFWDGRAATLEDQVLQPVVNPIEMHETWPNAVSELQSDTAYVHLFWNAFGSITVDSLKAARALSQFLRTMISGNSPWDRFRRGEGTIPIEAQAGYTLFQLEGGQEGMQIPLQGGGFVIGQGGADCFHCHTEAAGLFTDEQFHNNGLDTEPFADLGRGAITGDPFDNGKFKVPTLRNIMLTAPYMHDGRFATIDEVLDHYNDGGHPSTTVDPFMKFTDPDLTLELTPQKRAQIIAFLNSLTDTEFVNNPAFSDPGPP